MNRLIAVECYPDIEFAKSFGFTRKEIFHAGSISEVCKYINKNKQCCGLIDEDPYGTHPRILHTFIPFREDHDIKILINPNHGNLVYILRPRLEEWVLRAANSANINVASLGLPNNAKALHSVINSRPAKFQRLIESLQKQSPTFDSLRRLIKP